MATANVAMRVLSILGLLVAFLGLLVAWHASRQRYRHDQAHLRQAFWGVLLALEGGQSDPHHLMREHWNEHTRALAAFSVVARRHDRRAFGAAQQEFLAARAELEPAMLHYMRAQATGVVNGDPRRIIDAIRAVLAFSGPAP